MYGRALLIMILWAGILSAGCHSIYERDNDYNKLLTPGNMPVIPQNETNLPYTSLPNNGEGSFI